MTVQILCALFLNLFMAFDEGSAANLLWPAGRYGLPNTIYGCPNAKGFSWATGNITQALNQNNKKSSSFHLKATVTTKTVQRSFCIKNTGSLDPARPAWPAGRYCIYRKGGTCPTGLKQGSILWDNRFVFNYKKNIGVVPDGRSTSSNTLIYFCCSVNGDKRTPLPLPLESPFYLLAYISKTCQEVRGALHRNEFISYDTGKNSLAPPYPYGAGIYSMKINYCYYQACWTNLTSLNGTVMSPFYPTNYPSNKDCRWRIEVPVDYTMTLEFEDVDLEPSASCTKDWLQVSTENPATRPLKYCTKKVFVPFKTRSNVVVLDFHSDGGSSSNKGFRIHYRAERVPVSMTTTSQPTVTKTTNSTTTHKTASTSITTKTQATITTATAAAATTTAPAEATTTTTVPEKENNTQTSSRTQHPTSSTTERSHFSPLTDVSRPSSPATPVVRGARKKDLAYRVWVIAVAVCMVILLVTLLVLLVYFKCLRKRNTIRRRHSTVKYNRKCNYVDMEFHGNEAFGIRSDQNGETPVLYDNYPGDDSNYSEPNQKAVEGPLYEEVKDPARPSEKGQRNHVYESMAVTNDYQTPPSQRTLGVDHVYESATPPAKK